MTWKSKLTAKEMKLHRKAERIMDSLIKDPHIKNGAWLKVYVMFQILNGLLLKYTK